MKRITQLKDDALSVLDGNFGKAALATLGFVVISAFISFAFNMISGFNLLDYYDALLDGDFYGLMDAAGGNVMASLLEVLVSIFFTVPLAVGMANAYRALLESKGSDNNIFANFFKQGFGNHYFHIVLVSFVSGILIALLLIPAFLIVILVVVLLQSAFATVILVIATLVYTLWISLTYSQISFIVLNNPELDIIETMRTSRHLMAGKRMKYFLLELSFIGWILLGLLTLGIGYLWLMPYISTTEAAFYCDVRDAEKTGQA